MPFFQIANLLNRRHLLVVSLVGFASGLPLALTTSTLQAWYTTANVSVQTIGILSLIGLPYVWKFSWAPFFDRFTLLGATRRRGWMLLTQVALCLALFILAACHPERHPVFTGVVALVVAFFSASQDIAVDAYRTELLPTTLRGQGSAYYIFAYRLAMLVSGGFLLIIADKCGFALAYQTMAVLMGMMALITYYAPEQQTNDTPPTSLLQTMKDAWLNLLTHESIFFILLFTMLYKLGDAVAASLLTNFLIHDLSFTLTQIGVAYKSVSLLATISGSFCGGALLVRLGLYRALFWFGLAQAVSTLCFLWLALAGKSFNLMVACVFIENFCSAMGTVAFMAFIMSLCHPRYTATQYACFSALAMVGRVCVGPLAGMIVTQWGWVAFYTTAFALSFPGLLILLLLRKKVSFNAEMAIC